MNPEELRRYLLERFGDRRHANLDEVERLISDLRLSTIIGNIQDIDRVLNRTIDAVTKFEQDLSHVIGENIRIRDDGFVRLAVDLMDENFRVNRGARFQTIIVEYRKFIKPTQ